MKTNEELIQEYLSLQQSTDTLRPLLDLYTRDIPENIQTFSEKIADKVNRRSYEMQTKRMQILKETISTKAELFELHVSHTGTAPGSIPLSTFSKLTEKFSKLSKAIKDKLLLSDPTDFAKEDKNASNLILYPGAAGSFRIFLGAPHPIRPLFQDSTALAESDLAYHMSHALTDLLYHLSTQKNAESAMESSNKNILQNAQEFYEEIEKQDITLQYIWVTGKKKMDTLITPQTAHTTAAHIQEYILLHHTNDQTKTLTGHFYAMNTLRKTIHFKTNQESITIRYTTDTQILLLKHNVSLLRDKEYTIHIVRIEEQKKRKTPPKKILWELTDIL